MWVRVVSGCRLGGDEAQILYGTTVRRRHATEATMRRSLLKIEDKLFRGAPGDNSFILSVVYIGIKNQYKASNRSYKAQDPDK